MKRSVLLICCLAVMGLPHVSSACETGNITIAGNLDSRTPDGGAAPSSFLPIPEQIAAAQVAQQVEFFDSLGHKHSAIALFYKVGGGFPWAARLAITDEDLESAGDLSPVVGDAELRFDSDGNRVGIFADLFATFRWTDGGGMNRYVSVQFAVTNRPFASQTRAEQDGRELGCAKRGSLDFDGDGYDDFAIWRPEFGLWAVLKSSVPGGDLIFKQWGLPGDYPIPGDYTGDGKADLVLYRSGTAFWFICRSDLDYDCSLPQIVQFGLSGDIPVQGDYDGDGVLDIAVYRLSTNTFFYRSSKTTELTQRQWGLPGDIPLKAAINARPQ